MKNILKDNMERFNTKNLNEQTVWQRDELANALELLSSTPGAPLNNVAAITRAIQEYERTGKIDRNVARQLIKVVPFARIMMMNANIANNIIDALKVIFEADEENMFLGC